MGWITWKFNIFHFYYETVKLLNYTAMTEKVRPV